MTEGYRFSQALPENACTVLQITPRPLHILWIHWYSIMKLFDTMQWVTDVVASYDRSIASYNANSPQSAIQCFLFQFTVSSFFLKVIQWLLTSYSSTSRHFILPSIFPSITCCRRQFPRKMWPFRLSFLPCIVHMTFLSYLTLSNTPFFTCSVQLIFSILV